MPRSTATRFVIAQLCAALLLPACSSDPLTSSGRIPITTSRGTVKVAVKPDGITLAIGDTVRMRASTTPPLTVTWEWAVLPPNLASIDSRGLVEALDRGELEIRACTEVPPERACGFAPLTIR